MCPVTRLWWTQGPDQVVLVIKFKPETMERPSLSEPPAGFTLRPPPFAHQSQETCAVGHLIEGLKAYLLTSAHQRINQIKRTRSAPRPASPGSRSLRIG